MTFLQRFEEGAVVAVLLAMAALPLIEIVLRPLVQSGIPGSSLWVQHMVLWVCFLGAALAARRDELLSLTGGHRWFRGKLGDWSDVLRGGVSMAVCLVLAKAGIDLVVAERSGGQTLALGLPVWIAQAVMPLGFAIIAWRIFRKLPKGITERIVALAFLAVPIGLFFVSGLEGQGLVIPLVILVILAVALGAPIFVGLGGAAAILLWNNYDPVSAIPLEAYNLSVKPLLPTIPLFTLAGSILAEGGTPKRLVALFRALFGWMPGGVAVVSLFVCAFFTCFTGGSGVTILAMGALLFPMLIAEQHSERFTTGVLTSAGSLGLLFPPSLAVILYGIIAEVDIKTLFLAGIVPGLLQLGLVAAYVFFQSRRSGIERVPFHIPQAARALWDAKWEVAIPLVVLVSLLGGFATLVEASAVTALYAFVLEFFIRRDLSVKRDLLRVVGGAGSLIGGVLIILGVAMGLTNYLVIAGIPSLAVDAVRSFVDSPLVFLLLFNVFLLIVGIMMDIYSATVVVVPLIVPLAQLFNVDPYHLGIIFLTNLELGYLTPPVGMNLFLASYRFKKSLPEVYMASLPFLLIRVVVVALVTYLPWLSLVFV